ncbi:hypothetical protein CDD80_6314 [Ophiocordyceps camponoti-rufipedis]|uniref:3-keto-steroid reductase n=1 Tax=Ophiocordyceps camponoti-rufipedis TaxID=2004952 RepID=A0A2C5XF01_9HYPO|nr:hypothetical protein CDD80_6314 [Ophiocordyceps camponoti-rufipedis]
MEAERNGSSREPNKAAPWDSVPAHEQFFVLITGANSGVGLGTAKRLTDEFLATRSKKAHLVLVTTTRSAAKSRDTIRALRAYTADSRRVHVVSLTLDLCNLRQVRAFARALVDGYVANPDGDELGPVRVPRLDAVVFNAAYGGWVGCDYGLAVWSFLSKGLVQSVTWPDFKRALPTALLNDRVEYGYQPEEPLLGEVFTSCVFGHYMLAHELLPLLSRPTASRLAPGRIIWSSSLEAVSSVFTIDDIQCLDHPGAYESAKRLTDLLALTHSLPAARPFSSRWLGLDPSTEKRVEMIPPTVYLTHPGIVASTLFPVPWFLFWFYELALALSRWLGSPWHVADSQSGAKAAVWVALEDQSALDSLRAERVKWGSCADRRRRVDVKMTEVEGWGWEGKPEDEATRAGDAAEGILHRSQGRKYGSVDTTAEDIVCFEELGAACWKEMEELRARWDDLLDGKEGKKET